MLIGLGQHVYHCLNFYLAHLRLYLFWLTNGRGCLTSQVRQSLFFVLWGLEQVGENGAFKHVHKKNRLIEKGSKSMIMYKSRSLPTIKRV